MTPPDPPAERLREMLDLPAVELFEAIGSTLDVAHERAAAGAPAGTLILADAQTRGGGREGRSWPSEPGAGIWLPLIERPGEPWPLEVLPLRAGIGTAESPEP